MGLMFDVIVLGLGAMGSAATYQLAKSGCSVLGIDRFTPPHAFGSSHGETRITRLACGEGPMYTQFARRSHEIWRELEAETGVELFTQNGLLVISGPGRRAANHDEPDFLKRTIELAVLARVPHEVLDGRTAKSRFPAFNLNADDQIYFEPGAGFVRPEACIRTQIELAGWLGARIHVGEKVLSYSASASGVTVATDRATYAAKKLIVAAGPWLPTLLDGGLMALFTVRRQVLYWYRIEESPDRDRRYEPRNFPVFIWQLPASQSIYGFPALGGPDGGVKIATEQYREHTTADDVDRTVSDSEVREMYEAYVRPYFHGLTLPCIRSAVCLYTHVDGSRFIIDFHPESDRVIVASPCSGHGFKHSAAIGQALAQLATHGRSAFDLSSFTIR
jgi:sarcosine oxidase